MTTQIVFTRLNGDDRLAMVETAALMVLALAAMALLPPRRPRRLARGRRQGHRPVARPRRQRRARAPASRRRRVAARPGAPAAAPDAAAGVVRPASAPGPPSRWPPVFSPGNYAALFAEPERLRPLLNSLWMASVPPRSAAVGIALGRRLAGGAAAGARGRLIEGLLGAARGRCRAPSFAIALAALFSVALAAHAAALRPGRDRLDPAAGLPRAEPARSPAARCSPDSASSTPRSRRRRPRWGPAGRGPSGGSSLPLASAPALAAGATLAFVTALGDFVTSIMLYTYDTRPISLEILGSLRQGDVGVGRGVRRRC